MVAFAPPLSEIPEESRNAAASEMPDSRPSNITSNDGRNTVMETRPLSSEMERPSVAEKPLKDDW
jgi:hypothetical protein